MQGKQRERWHELCERAAVEQDSDKLMALIKEIMGLLYEKEARLKARDAAAADKFIELVEEIYSTGKRLG